MTERRFFALTMVSGVALGAFLIGSVILSGGTFEQRCKRAGYSAAKLERCISRASDGGPIYEENIGVMP